LEASRKTNGQSPEILCLINPLSFILNYKVIIMSATTQEQRQKEIDQAWEAHQKSAAPSKAEAWRQAEKQMGNRLKSSV
jgi:hypothetical protein